MERLLSLMGAEGLEGFLITDPRNMYYFTGFSGGSMLLITRDAESILFVYGVNYEAAKVKVEGAQVELIEADENPIGRVVERLEEMGVRSLGFDSLKASTYLKLKSSISRAELRDSGRLVWELRKIKDRTEILLMRRAAELTSMGMRRAMEVVEAGLTERMVAAEIEYEMRRTGSDGVAFDTIVSSGPDSAFPHGGCGDRVIRRGDFVLVDIGAKYMGYCSDLTRTFIMGDPSPKQRRIYEAVRKAQELAVNAARAGVKAKDVDRAAREHISGAGYGEHFVHGLGHGIGLDVHEPPRLSPRSRDVLVEGNVVTVEPGVYIPKFGGVRIEDTVLITADEAEKLTEAPVQMVL